MTGLLMAAGVVLAVAGILGSGGVLALVAGVGLMWAAQLL